MNYGTITLVFFLCAGFVLVERRMPDRIKIVLYVAFAVMLSVIFALRNPETTSDTAEYVKVFNKVSIEENWVSRIERFEPGYCFLNRIVKYFTIDYKWLFFIISITIYLLFLKSVKNITEEYKKNANYLGKNRLDSFFYPLSFFLVYTAYFGLLYNSIAIRQGIAIPLIYIACIFSKSNRKIYAGISIIIACLLHQTAILAVPIIVISFLDIEINKRFLSKFVFGMLIFYCLGFSNYTTIFIQYIVKLLYNRFPNVQLFWWSIISIGNKEIISSGFSIYRLLNYIIVFMLLLFVDGNKKANFYTLISVIGLFIITLFGGLEIVMRLAEYYTVSICLAIYQMLVVSNQCLNFRIFNIKIKVPKSGFILLLSILYYIVFIRNVVLVLQ